ncbi:TPA: 30S ribosomal protein S3ae [archaeon]|uniref:Small ribosomal subunit protein eS1 n=1 Tax=Candidatus Naiadarchaeum limnaeum TaxID=2756139 RepID=A0A832X6G6_9ARCH|nr:30S ribosomal protein S3ae [Candidatus Naiadarchaeum limnaeum]
MVKAAVDKWKLKKWYEIIAPPLFKEQQIGETVANDHRQLIGRIIEVALSDLTNDPKLQRIKLRFRIHEVKGERALTNFLGHVITQDYEHSLVRRRTSKIYANQTIETKDGQKVVVKSFMITMVKLNLSRRNALRKKLVEVVDSFAKTETFDDFINSVLYGKLSTQVKKELHKIYPLRHAVVQKTEIPQIAVEVKS